MLNSRGMLHFDAHFENLLTDGDRIYFADFGLALYDRFDLTPAESAFYRQHVTYDRCYTVTHLTRWLVSKLTGLDPAGCDAFLQDLANGQRLADLPAPAAEIVARHARTAVAMTRFFRDLQTKSRYTPYPVKELLQTGAANDRAGSPN